MGQMDGWHIGYQFYQPWADAFHILKQIWFIPCHLQHIYFNKLLRADERGGNREIISLTL